MITAKSTPLHSSHYLAKAMAELGSIIRIGGNRFSSLPGCEVSIEVFKGLPEFAIHLLPVQPDRQQLTKALLSQFRQRRIYLKYSIDGNVLVDAHLDVYPDASGASGLGTWQPLPSSQARGEWALAVGSSPSAINTVSI